MKKLLAERLLITSAIVLIVFALSAGLVKKDDSGNVEFAASFGPKPLTSIGLENPTSVKNLGEPFTRIESWISATGAGVSAADLDGDGEYSEYCLSDPRFNTITVGSAPNKIGAFEPFDLIKDLDKTEIAVMGCTPADFNEDGWQDFLVYFWGRTPLIFLRQLDSPSNLPKFSPIQLTSETERWSSSTALVSDVNGDSHLDVIIGNYLPDNNSILGRIKGGASKMEMHESMASAANGGANRLFVSRVDGRGRIEWEDWSESLPNRKSWTLAIGAADLNGDLRPELFFANDFGPDVLALNQSTKDRPSFVSQIGEKGFFDPKSDVLGADSFKGMGVDFGDLNDDGLLDIFVSNLASPTGLLETHHAWIQKSDEPLRFENKAQSLGFVASGWSWDAKIADFDSNGSQEIIQATGFVEGVVNQWPEVQEMAMTNDLFAKDVDLWPTLTQGADISGSDTNAFFSMNSNGRYVDIAEKLGFDEATPTRGFAIADSDGDGDLDIFQANQFSESRFWENKCRSECGESLILDLRRQIGRSKSLTRTAVGARVKISDPQTGHAKEKTIALGNGHASSNSPELHFGLGNFSSQEIEVEISWFDSAGKVRAESLSLKPGRHRVVLDNLGG